MMGKWLLGIAFTVSLLLESSVSSLPLTFVVLLITYVFTRKTFVFALAFAVGLVLDFLLLRPLGQSSMLFLLFLIAVFLYERKFEVLTLPFVVVFSLVSALIFLWVFERHVLIWQALTVSLFAGGLLIVTQNILRRGKRLS